MFPSLSKCRTKKVFLALFILTTVNAQSEEQITGFVYHAETSAPLVGVNVILLGTDLGAATNESGSFSISNVAQGEYNLLVSAIGFSETLEIVKVPLESPLEIWLMETFFQMEEVVVTGTRTEKIHAEAPIATEIISKQDILDSGARDVGELLDERAGISMSESVEGGTIINMLGMDSKYILVLVDGQPVTGKFNSRIGLDQISTAAVDKIEIIKGPSSSLYGSEAMGGVINIITKRKIFVNPLTVHTRFSAGKDSFQPFDLGLGTRDLRLNWNWQGETLTSHADIDFLKANVDKNIEYIDVDQYDKWTARGDVSWAVNDRHQLKFNINRFMNDERNHTTLLDGETIIDRKTLIGDYRWVITDSWKLGTILRRDIYSRQYTEERPDGEIVKDDLTEEVQDEVEINLIRESENQTLSLGAEIRRESYANDRVGGGETQKLSGTGFFLQWDRSITSDITFVAGFRVDDNNEIDKPVISPRLGAMYTLSERWKFRTSWGKGFRMPSFMDRYMDWNHWQFGYSIEGNPSLKPETSEGLNAGFEYYHPGVYKFSIMAYVNTFENMIVDWQLEPGLFTYMNIDSVRYLGIEVQHRQTFSRSWLASWGYNFSHNRNLKTDEIVPDSPVHSANARISYKSRTGRLSSALKVKWVAPYTVEVFEPDIGSEEGGGEFVLYDRDSFALFDYDGKFRFSQMFTLSIGVKNIFDTVDEDYGPWVGRTIYIELVTKLGRAG